MVWKIGKNIRMRERQKIEQEIIKISTWAIMRIAITIFKRLKLKKLTDTVHIYRVKSCLKWSTTVDTQTKNNKNNSYNQYK